ncbi:MAG: myo-inositol 2-dehydrogenase / D-chiro-inositol 1-dehydrogenase [Thermoleophilaceae bacterium]|jgi:myo-inositol 2-dehydrogenase/D-chiro-inositol 1-dehydrogenase|nr:myo-inositol 2-dehydrogenase / D-chiro-inositol 1-dehydrogenase [Thermoleophilaceae bacterium]
MGKGRVADATPIGIALVGVGDIGTSGHLPAIEAGADARLIALVDADEIRLARAASRLEHVVDVHAKLDPVLEDPRIEAIVLATPPWVTARLAPLALEAGAYVLAEKPLAVSSAEAESLRRLDGPSRDRLQTGFTYRHHPSIEHLRTLVRSKALGPSLLIRIAAFDEIADPVGSPDHYARMVRTLEHGMPIVHEGAHLCDWLNFLTGDTPATVSAVAVKTDPSLPTPNFNVARAEYPDGTVACLETGWLTPELPPSHFTVTGSRGQIHVDMATFALEGVVDGTPVRVAAGSDRVSLCFALQLERFLASVRAGRPPVPGLEEGLASLRFTERLVEATQDAGR